MWRGGLRRRDMLEKRVGSCRFRRDSEYGEEVDGGWLCDWGLGFTLLKE